MNVLSTEKAIKEGKPINPPLFDITHSALPEPPARKFVNLSFLSFNGMFILIIIPCTVFLITVVEMAKEKEQNLRNVS